MPRSKNHGIANIGRKIGAARVHHHMMRKNHATSFRCWKLRPLGQIDMRHVIIQHLMTVLFEIIFKKMMRFWPHSKIAPMRSRDMIQIDYGKGSEIPAVCSIFTPPSKPVAHRLNAIQMPIVSFFTCSTPRSSPTGRYSYYRQVGVENWA